MQQMIVARRSSFALSGLSNIYEVFAESLKISTALRDNV